MKMNNTDKKLVNIKSTAPIYTLPVPIKGPVLRIRLTVEEIYKSLCAEADLEEILSDGSFVKLDLTNYNTVNDPATKKPAKVEIPVFTAPVVEEAPKVEEPIVEDIPAVETPVETITEDVPADEAPVEEMPAVDAPVEEVPTEVADDTEVSETAKTEAPKGKNKNRR